MGKGIAHDWLPEGWVRYWEGWSGSIEMVDVDKRMTISYVIYKMRIRDICSERTGE